MNCVICSSDILHQSNGWDKGHNPSPIKEDGRCCEECNSTVVIPTRLSKFMSIEEARELVKENNIE